MNSGPSRKKVIRSLLLLSVAALVGGTGWFALQQTRHVAASYDSVVPQGLFLPTHANMHPPSTSAPNGMAWAPEGEFSMSSVDPRTLSHDGMQSMEDACPIHRVYVDGFWMEKTDVTNAQFVRLLEQPDM